VATPDKECRHRRRGREPDQGRFNWAMRM